MWMCFLVQAWSVRQIGLIGKVECDMGRSCGLGNREEGSWPKPRAPLE